MGINMINEFLKKLKNNKFFSNSKIMLLVIGMCFCLMLLFFLNANTPKMLDNTAKKNIQEGISSEFEMLLSQIKGAGRTNAFINHDTSTGDVKGVIIVSQGAGDIKVKLMLAVAASTALNVPMDKIEVFEMQKGD